MTQTLYYRYDVSVTRMYFTRVEVMAKTITVGCLGCFKYFQAQRATATFCGGTCRQRFNRAMKKYRAEEQTKSQSATSVIKLSVSAEIERVWNHVQAFTERFTLEDLLIEDIGPLEMALEALNELVNPICEECEEKPANGWEDIKTCRRCEIQRWDLYCDECGSRRPSIASDEMLCRQCAKQREA